MDVSIVIPIYNSANLIEDAILRINKTLNGLPLNYEIIFRDDSSTDGSKEVLKKVSKKYKNVRCFYNKLNEGIGYTLIKLFQVASGELVFYSDCDLPFSQDVFLKIMKDSAGADIVVYSRYKEIKNQIPVFRKLISRLYYYLCRSLFGINVKDIGSGAVAIRRKALDNFKFYSFGFTFHVEIFINAQDLGLTIKEIAAKWHGNSSGSFSIVKHGPKTIIESLILSRKLKKGFVKRLLGRA